MSFPYFAAYPPFLFTPYSLYSVYTPDCISLDDDDEQSPSSLLTKCSVPDGAATQENVFTSSQKFYQSTRTVSPSSSVDSNIPSRPETTNRKRKVEPDSVKSAPKKTKTSKERSHEDYGTYDPEAEVTPDHDLSRYCENEGNKKSFWFFILSALADPTNNDIISWTGRGYEFRITSQDGLMELYRQDKKRNDCHWTSLRRNFRLCYKKRILIPVDARKNIFAFVTEPSVHLPGWTKETLKAYIEKHHRSVITSSPASPLRPNSSLHSSSPTPSLTATDPIQPLTPVPSFIQSAPLAHRPVSRPSFTIDSILGKS